MQQKEMEVQTAVRHYVVVGKRTSRYLTDYSRNFLSLSPKKQKGRKLKGKVNKSTLYFNYCQVPRCFSEEFHVHINYFCALAYLQNSK